MGQGGGVGHDLLPAHVVPEEVQQLERDDVDDGRALPVLRHEVHRHRLAVGAGGGADATALGLERRQLGDEALEGTEILGIGLRVAGHGVEDRRQPVGDRGDPLPQHRRRGLGSGVVDRAVGQRVAELGHLVEIEDRLGPRRRREHAPEFLGRVADADLVVDVGVGQRHVGDDQVGHREALQHLGDDQGTDVLVGPDRLVAEGLQHRPVDLVEEGVEVDLGRRVLTGGAGGLRAERHHHEGDREGHRLQEPLEVGLDVDMGPDVAVRCIATR